MNKQLYAQAAKAIADNLGANKPYPPIVKQLAWEAVARYENNEVRAQCWTHAISTVLEPHNEECIPF